MPLRGILGGEHWPCWPRQLHQRRAAYAYPSLLPREGKRASKVRAAGGTCLLARTLERQRPAGRLPGGELAWPPWLSIWPQACARLTFSSFASACALISPRPGAVPAVARWTTTAMASAQLLGKSWPQPV